MMIEFSKMHGLGNDFMVIDLVRQNMTINADLVRALANRRTGVGFDQLLIVEPPSAPDLDFNYRIFNADGSEVGMCGNGARCFMAFIHAKRLTQKPCVRVQTRTGVLNLGIDQKGWVKVGMGAPKFLAHEIPFCPKNNDSDDADKHYLDIDGKRVGFYVVNVGNPHAVIVVDDVQNAPVQRLGSALGAHPAFGDGVNVGFVQVVNHKHIRLRVFERGVGETAACGSGACAAVAAGARAGYLAKEAVRVQMYGGSLLIEHHQGKIIMHGTASFVYDGVFSPDGMARQHRFKLPHLHAHLLL